MLKDIFSKLLNKENEATKDTQSDEAQTQHAFTALLVEAACADEEYTDTEKTLILKLVQRQFGLDEAAALRLREDAEQAQKEANDMYRFSSKVKNGLNQDEKIELLEGMWEIILSDDHRDPYEDMIIRRLSGLIYVEDTDAQAARRRVEARLAK